jgi:hypothetical protein
MSAMMPKRIGRPSKFTLGMWPEKYIRDVIRAVVYEHWDTKNDTPDFAFKQVRSSRDTVFPACVLLFFFLRLSIPVK